MSNLIRGQLLKPLCEGAEITEHMRVLHVTPSLVVLIDINQKKSSNRYFYSAPRAYSRDVLEAQLAFPDPKIAMTCEGAAEGDRSLTDDELQRKYDGQPDEEVPALKTRTKHWDMIVPLVSTDDAVLLFDKEVRSCRIKARAAELSDSPTGRRTKVRQIECLLYCYWAGNFNRRSLTPRTERCGGKGKARPQSKKLGRRPAGASPDDPTSLGFVLTEHDKEIIAHCWRNYYVRGTTMPKACRRMWSEFYSVEIQGSDGCARTELRPVHLRPTIAQFKKWGKQQNPGLSGWKRHFSASALARIDRCLKASANEGIVAVGQRAAVDSTTTDQALVSLMDRLKRIGFANRILVVDMRHGYIPGFYMGLGAPSAETVKLAFLHAVTDKAEWLQFLGLDDQSPDDWIPIAFVSAIADNTDLRCEAVHSGLASVETFLHIPVARSDLNAMVEVRHHVIHRMVDHNLEGTTYGRRSERGEASADLRACQTTIEAIRESARAIHAYNTMSLDRAPTLEEQRAGVKLSRLELTRWDINQGKVARSLISISEARRNLLPRYKGTFTASGVRLHNPRRGGNARVFIERLRYISQDVLITRKILEAKLSREKRPPEYFDDFFLCNPFNLKKIWHVDVQTGREIELELVSNDRDLPYEASLHDILDIEDQDQVRRPAVKEEQNRILAGMEDQQHKTNSRARHEHDLAVSALAKPPSKASLVSDKKENRQAEHSMLMGGIPVTYEPEEDVFAGVTSLEATVKAEPTKQPERKSIFGGVVECRVKKGRVA